MQKLIFLLLTAQLAHAWDKLLGEDEDCSDTKTSCNPELMLKCSP